MPRTVFVWTPAKLALLERHVVGFGTIDIGRIVEAPYLEVREPRGLSWLLGLSKARPILRTPFSEHGEDVRGLLAGSHQEVADDVFDEVRLARGTIRCLVPREDGYEVVLRDAWSTRGGIACRVVDAIQFALVPDAGRPIAVAFAQAPLVIATPREGTLATVLATLDDRAQHGLLRPFRTPSAPEMPHYFHMIELREGDRIEVLGITLDARLTRRFDVGQRTASYRETSNAISLVLGDAPGLRMVIRKLG